MKDNGISHVHLWHDYEEEQQEEEEKEEELHNEENGNIEILY